MPASAQKIIKVTAGREAIPQAGPISGAASTASTRGSVALASCGPTSREATGMKIKAAPKPEKPRDKPAANAVSASKVRISAGRVVAKNGMTHGVGWRSSPRNAGIDLAAMRECHVRMLRMAVMALFLGAAPLWAAEKHNCRCIYDGGAISEGGTACLKTSSGYALARCGKVLNNTSWKFLGKSCNPLQSRNLTIPPARG